MKKTMKLVAALISVAVSGIASGQVPALVTAASAQEQPMPKVQMISPDRIYLDPKESYGARLAEKWKTNPDKPRQGEDGSVRYLYGATLPTLVCTPLEVCAIQLQPGEVVNDVHAGDTARWKITPATSGAGAGQTTHVIVKPTDAGLTTNLLITTDRRVYTIKLASTQKTWIPVLSFDYPDDVQSAWQSYKQQQRGYQAATVLPTGQNLANLDFGFRVSGDSPRWKPLRVYSDGLKTYIQFPGAMAAGDAPALVAEGSGGKEIVNYRVLGDRYVVDRVLDRALLITGVGRDQVEVKIVRTGGR